MASVHLWDMMLPDFAAINNKQAQSQQLISLTLLQMEWEMFSNIKQRVAQEWRELPPTADVLSQPLKEKIKEVTSRMGRADIFE